MYIYSFKGKTAMGLFSKVLLGAYFLWGGTSFASTDNNQLVISGKNGQNDLIASNGNDLVLSGKKIKSQFDMLREQVNKRTNEKTNYVEVRQELVDKKQKVGYKSVISFSTGEYEPSDRDFTIHKNVKRGDVLIYEKDFYFCLKPNGAYTLQFEAYNGGWFYGDYFNISITFKNIRNNRFSHITKRLFSDKGTHLIRTEGDLMDSYTDIKGIRYISGIEKINIKLLEWE